MNTHHFISVSDYVQLQLSGLILRSKYLNVMSCIMLLDRKYRTCGLGQQ